MSYITEGGISLFYSNRAGENNTTFKFRDFLFFVASLNQYDTVNTKLLLGKPYYFSPSHIII
jgi:hypothetical protein